MTRSARTFYRLARIVAVIGALFAAVNIGLDVRFPHRFGAHLGMDAFVLLLEIVGFAACSEALRR